MNEDSHQLFETTHWTLVGSLSDGGESGRRAADELARRYWPAVYAYFRRSGLDREEAAERTQAFYAEAVIGRRLFERADPEKGRLRSLFLASLRNFQIDRHRAATRTAARHVTLSDEICRGLGSHGDDPCDAFNREWAADQLNEALARTKAYYVSRGMGTHWEVFEARHLAPLRSNTPPLQFRDIAAQHGYDRPANAAAATQQVRQCLLVTLKAVVAETVADLNEADQEYAETLGLLGQTETPPPPR